MAAVSVKQKILDSLGMFWGKLKTTYVTSTASNAGDNLALAASAGYSLQQQINTLNSKTIKKSNVLVADVTFSVGNNTISFNLPSDFNTSYGCVVAMAWPHSTWSNAYVVVTRDRTITNGEGMLEVYSGSAQSFAMFITLLYI